MITDKLRSTWSSPVGPFTVENSKCSRGCLEDEKLGSWATFVTHLGSDLGSVWSGCTAGFVEAGMVSPGFWIL